MGKPGNGAKGFRVSRIFRPIPVFARSRGGTLSQATRPTYLVERLHADAFQEPLVEGGRQLWLRAIPPAVGERLARVHDLLALLAPPVDDEVPFVADTDFFNSGRRRPTTAP